MKETKEKKQSLPGASKMRAMVSKEIMTILERHKKIAYNVLKLNLVQKYGATDKMIYEFLEMFQKAGVLKYDEELVELISNDLLRQEDNSGSEDDRTRTDNGDNQSEERQV